MLILILVYCQLCNSLLLTCFHVLAHSMHKWIAVNCTRKPIFICFLHVPIKDSIIPTKQYLSFTCVCVSPTTGIPTLWPSGSGLIKRSWLLSTTPTRVAMMSQNGGIASTNVFHCAHTNPSTWLLIAQSLFPGPWPGFINTASNRVWNRTWMLHCSHVCVCSGWPCSQAVWEAWERG